MNQQNAEDEDEIQITLFMALDSGFNVAEFFHLKLVISIKYRTYEHM